MNGGDEAIESQVANVQEKKSPKVKIFNPEAWAQVSRFRHFHVMTYKLERRDFRALTGVEAHFRKYINLYNLAVKLSPNLLIDRDELNASGYSPAINAAELVTVIESAILELYSCLDCTRKVLQGIYGKTTSGFSDSTRKLFQSPERLKGSFPDELKNLISKASWYRSLLHLRDELTHLDTGSVHLNKETNKIQYFHFEMRVGDKPFMVEDIFAWLMEKASAVNGFTGHVFHHLNETLVDRPIHQICGLFDFRIYHRFVSPLDAKNIDSGYCGAWTWFDLPEHPTCPFKDECGAYHRKAPVEWNDHWWQSPFTGSAAEGQILGTPISN